MGYPGGEGSDRRKPAGPVDYVRRERLNSRRGVHSQCDGCFGSHSPQDFQIARDECTKVFLSSKSYKPGYEFAASQGNDDLPSIVDEQLANTGYL